MLTGFLRSLEDPNKPLLGPTDWILRKMGLILSDSKPRNAFCISMHIFIAYFVFTEFLELSVIQYDLDLVLNNLKVSIMSIVIIVKSFTFMLWQGKWRKLLAYVCEADQFERDTDDPVKARIVESYTRYCRRGLLFYWVLTVMTVVAFINTPLMIYLSSANYRDRMRDGTEPFPHIFSAWSPIDKNNPPGSWCTVVLHVIACSYGGGIMAAFDSTVMVIMVFFGGKLDLLRVRCSQIFGANSSGVACTLADARIRELHRIHNRLMKNLKLFNSLLSPVMFVYVIICSSVLCFSAYQLTIASDTTQKLLMAEYFAFGVSQLFLYCWHSNDVIVKILTRCVIGLQCGSAALGPYESEWWSAGPRQRGGARLLAGQLRRVHVFTAGPFTQLTLATFLTILKGAYSYYTLLRD